MLSHLFEKKRDLKYLDFSNSSKRDRTFDLLKLYAMLSVVLDHSLQHMLGGNIQSTHLYNWIFISQMPIFMFAAGYFALNGIYKDSSLENFFRRIGKTIIALFIPFISYSIIVSFLGQRNIVAISFFYPDNSLWFLWALMWMHLMMFTSQQIVSLFVKPHIKRVVFSVIIYILELIPIGIIYLLCSGLFGSKLIVFYSLFYLSGYIYSMIEKHYPLFSKEKYKLLCILLSAIVVAFVMIKHPTIINEKETVLNTIVRCIGSISAVILMLYLSSFALKCNWVKKISAFGVLSLEMYFIHLLVLRFSFFNSSEAPILIFIFKYLLIVIISLLLVILLKLFWTTDLLLFGKFPQKKI